MDDEHSDVDSVASHLSDDSANYGADQHYKPRAMERYLSPMRHTITNTTNDEVHSVPISRITTTASDQYFYLDNEKFSKKDLLDAFGGNLQPGQAPPPVHKFANPAPLGLSALALTMFVHSLVNFNARGVKIANIVVAPAVFYGGLIQILCGMWEIAVQNTFGGTVLASFGGFWFSFAALYIDWFGIHQSFTNDNEFENAIGFFFLGWSIFSFGVTLCTLKSTLALVLLFISIFFSLLLLSIAKFTKSIAVTKAAGIIELIAACLSWYNAFAGLATKENSYVIAHVISLDTVIEKIKKKRHPYKKR